MILLVRISTVGYSSAGFSWVFNCIPYVLCWLANGFWYLSHTHTPVERSSLRDYPCEQVCTSLQTDNQASTQFFTGRTPFLSPSQQRQSTEGRVTIVKFSLRFFQFLLFIFLYRVSAYATERSMWTLFEWLRTKLFVKTFHEFPARRFKKNVSHVRFWNLAVSNTCARRSSIA